MHRCKKPFKIPKFIALPPTRELPHLVMLLDGKLVPYKDRHFSTVKVLEFIRRKLLENAGNIKRTAERIQLQRSNLYKKLDKYGLK